MKKIMATTLACVMAFSLTACGQAKQEAANTPIESTAVEKSTQETKETAAAENTGGEVGGTIAGEWIKETLTTEEEAKVLVLGNPELKALIERANGLKEGIKAKAPGAIIVSEQAASTPEAGLSVTENALLKNPDINVVVSCNDSAALGAYEALAAAGKKPGEVCIVGLDATEEALKRISEETMFVGTVDVAPFLQGPLALETALRVIKEGKLSEDIYVDFVPVTIKNIKDYVK